MADQATQMAADITSSSPPAAASTPAAAAASGAAGAAVQQRRPQQPAAGDATVSVPSAQVWLRHPRSCVPPRLSPSPRPPRFGRSAPRSCGPG